MIDKILKIEGLDCANCARELEEELAKLDGIESACVDFMASKVILRCEESAIEGAVYCCNHFEEVKVIEEGTLAESRRDGKKIKIKNLCCANCARELEEELNGVEGVSATVDFMNMTVILNASTSEAYEQAIYRITHFEDVQIVDGDGKGERKSVMRENLVDVLAVAISLTFFVPALILDILKVEGVLWLNYCLYGVAFLAAGYIVLWNTARNILKGKVFDENFLMTVASVGAIVLGVTTGDGLMEGVAVMLLYRLGELLQAIAVGSSRRSITKLMDLKSDVATLVKDGVQTVVSPESLLCGDVIVVKVGEKVPVDCRVIEGQSSLDMKSLNGESVPKDVTVGDEVLSGAINVSGVIYAEVVREYKNSAVAKILELVENSTAKKAKSEKFITRFAKYYTPAVVAAAIVVAALVPTVVCAVNGAFGWAVYRDWIYKALSFLVISCPCALVISVPLAYFGGIGRSAKSGILVKGSTGLDALAVATVAAFDKTGTLTEGVFAVKSFSSERALQLAAAAEKFSAHPIAAAFNGVQTPYVVTDVSERAGRGVACLCGGNALLCGNASLLKEEGIEFTPVSSASTTVYVALGGEYVGVIEIDDVVKSGAKEAITALKNAGVKNAYMLTGDNAARAESIADGLGLDGVYASLLPDQKLAVAQKLKESGKLVYVGDGINDAPVMTVADCAVSMGKVGSDAAIEASDFVLVSDELSRLAEAKRVAKGTRRIVFQNIIGSLVVKFAVMALSIAIPEFPLIVSIFADVGVMLLAVLNSLRTALIK